MKKKFLAAVLSLLVSFGLWYYVITVVSPGSDDTFYNIPVIFLGEASLTERELMITSVPVEEVTLKLEGNRSDLTKINRSNIDVMVDLSKISYAGTHRVRFDVAYPGDVPPNAFTILEQTPAEIVVVVENRNTVSIPVVVDYGNTNVPEGFIADTDGAELDYSRINVTGPESVVSQISHARIQVDLTEQKESIVAGKYPITLCNKDGEPMDVELVSSNISEVQLTLKVLQWADIPLKVDVIGGGGATSKNTTVKLEPASIKLAGSEAALRQLREGIVVGEINLGTMTEDTSKVFPVEHLIPEGITSLSNITETKADISFAKLRVREFSIPAANIELLNVPEGMEPVLLADALIVRVRGSIAQVEKMSVTDLTVRVNIANMAVGTATFKAEIAISGQYADVGELGTHNVSVELREKTEEKG